jgi:ABC-type transport system involved in multi-copper enzyme maturation permease subunit
MVTRVSALIAAVALFLGLALLGDTPDTRDSSGLVAAYFVAHSTSVLAGAVLLGIAIAALLVLASSLGNHVSQSAATVVATVMLTALVLPYVALAYVVGAEASGAAKPIFELTLVATPVIALPLALLVGSTGLAAIATHRRFGLASLALAALMVIASASFAARGYFSPDVQQQVVFQGLLVWLVTVALTRRGEPSALPRPRRRAEPLERAA